MTCPACLAFDGAERAAIEDRELPEHSLEGCTCEDEHEIDVLALPPWRLFKEERGAVDLSRFADCHVGLACKMRWPELCGYLERSTAGAPEEHPDPEIAKRHEGGYTGGLYREGWRSGEAFIHTELLTIDLDGHGETERAAEALAPLRKAIHSTYKSTSEAPRCRVVLQLSKPCTDLQAYKRAHAGLRERLYAWGYVRPDKTRKIRGDIDEGASDATRLNFAPMHHPSRAPRFLATDGAFRSRFDCIPPPPPKSKPRPAAPPRDRNPDRYREGALRSASEEVRTAYRGAAAPDDLQGSGITRAT